MPTSSTAALPPSLPSPAALAPSAPLPRTTLIAFGLTGAGFLLHPFAACIAIAAMLLVVGFLRPQEMDASLRAIGRNLAATPTAWSRHLPLLTVLALIVAGQAASYLPRDDGLRHLVASQLGHDYAQYHQHHTLPHTWSWWFGFEWFAGQVMQWTGNDLLLSARILRGPAAYADLPQPLGRPASGHATSPLAPECGPAVAGLSDCLADQHGPAGSPDAGDHPRRRVDAAGGLVDRRLRPVAGVLVQSGVRGGVLAIPAAVTARCMD
jgi:hypothetical protein